MQLVPYAQVFRPQERIGLELDRSAQGLRQAELETFLPDRQKEAARDVGVDLDLPSRRRPPPFTYVRSFNDGRFEAQRLAAEGGADQSEPREEGFARAAVRAYASADGLSARNPSDRLGGQLDRSI